MHIAYRRSADCNCACFAAVSAQQGNSTVPFVDMHACQAFLCCIDEVHGLHNAEDRDDCAEFTAVFMCTSTLCTP